MPIKITPRKQQADRYLKRLSQAERTYQRKLRTLIKKTDLDYLFTA